MLSNPPPVVSEGRGNLDTLFVCLHSNPPAEIGGGVFSFIGLIKHATTPSRKRVFVLETSPSYKESFQIPYISIKLRGTIQYERFGEQRPSIRELSGMFRLLVSAILKGVNTVRNHKIQIVVSSNERLPNILISYAISSLTNRRCVVLLRALPLYESAASTRKPKYDIKSILFSGAMPLGAKSISSFLWNFVSYLSVFVSKRSICISNNPIYTDLLRANGYKTVVTGLLGGIDTSHLANVSPDQKRYDAFYGSSLIDAGKGVMDLLNIWTSVVNLNPTAKLLVAGKTSPRLAKLIQSEYETPSLKNNLVIGSLAGVPRGTMYELMARCKILVYPSRRDAAPLMVMEALAEGLPVVMYDGGYAAGVFEEHDFLRIVRTGDTELMVREICSLLTSDLHQLSLDAMAYAARFDSRLVYENLLKVIVESVAMND